MLANHAWSWTWVPSWAKPSALSVRCALWSNCTAQMCLVSGCPVNRLWVGWPSWWNPGNWSESGQRICCFNSFQVWVEREERSRSKRCAFVTRQRQPSQNPWTESWNGRSRRKMAQQRSYEAEAEVEPRNWEKRNSVIAFQEINQEFVSQRFQLHQTSRWADQAHRDKISLYGDLELTNRVFEENHARDCQQIGELVENLLRRNRSSKTSKNWWIVYASRGESYCCESVVDTDSGITEQSKFLVSQMRQNFTTLNRWAALERPTFPVNPWIFRVPEECWAAILECRLRNTMGTSGNVFVRLLGEKDDPLHSSAVQRIWHPPLKNWDLILQKLQGDKGVKWKENRWTRQSLYRISNEKVACWIILVELVLTVVWLILRNFRFRNCIWGNFRNLWNFKAEKSTSTLKHVRKQQTLISQCNRSKKLRWQSQLTNLWHRYRLWCEQISPTSICLMRWLRLHWKDFSTNMFTSAREWVSKSSVLKNIIGSWEEDKLLTWSMSISVQAEPMKRYKDCQTCSVYACIMTTSKISTFDGIKLYYQSTSDMPSDVILEGLYKSKLQDSVQLQTVLALYDQETVRNSGQKSYVRLKTSISNKRETSNKHT